MPGRLALGPKLQPVAKIAANQLLQPLDLALEPPPDVLLHAEWQGLAPCRDTIPFQQALADSENAVERAMISQVAAELALPVTEVRPRDIFAHRLWRPLQQALEPRDADVVALSPWSEIDRLGHRRQSDEIHEPAVLAKRIGGEVV